MQLGQLPFQGLVKGRIPADVASAAGADAETIHGVFDRVHYLKGGGKRREKKRKKREEEDEGMEEWIKRRKKRRGWGRREEDEGMKEEGEVDEKEREDVGEDERRMSG